MRKHPFVFPKDADKPGKQLSLAQRNLKKFRRAADMTQYELDDRVGVPRGRTASYENGKAEPTDEFLQAAAFAVNIKDWNLFKKPLEADLHVSQPADQSPAMVPYWGTVPCGEWEAPVHDPELVPVSAVFRGRGDIVAVKATGESMMPLYKPGQLVPIRTVQRKTEGAISLIQNEEGELSLKVARRFPGGDWEFHSINPLYGRITSEGVRLLGVAVHVPELLDLEGVIL